MNQNQKGFKYFIVVDLTWLIIVEIKEICNLILCLILTNELSLISLSLSENRWCYDKGIKLIFKVRSFRVYSSLFENETCFSSPIDFERLILLTRCLMSLRQTNYKALQRSVIETRKTEKQNKTKNRQNINNSRRQEYCRRPYCTS